MFLVVYVGEFFKYGVFYVVVYVFDCWVDGLIKLRV